VNEVCSITEVTSLIDVKRERKHKPLMDEEIDGGFFWFQE